jgi:hypothetical protein
MSSNSKFYASLADTGNAIGKGLIAGFFGTVAITVSQLIEMKITKRGESSAPVKVAGEVMGVEPKGLAEKEKEKTLSESGEASAYTKKEVEENESKFGQLMHFSYGTGWGVARGILDVAGIRSWPATAVHFGALWGTALVMLPKSGASEPITKWSPKQIAIDVVHHAVYSLAAGWIYDKMTKAKNKC